MHPPSRVEDGKLIFDCGCVLNAEDGIDFDPDNVKLDCPITWDIFARGDTKGVFQLESHIGRKWSKKLAPQTLEHLAALTAILRPGCLNSKVILEPACEANDFKEKSVNITELYCLRKNGELESTPFDPAVEDVLQKTYQTMIYQENAMQVAAKVAAFTLVQADNLRKAIGKKLAEEMAKVKIMFYEGCRKLGLLSEEKMIELFGWIENSQRYSFNKSHSVSYAKVAYMCAYVKAHFPIEFFQAWLTYAGDDADPRAEVRSLVNDAKLRNIGVYTPSIFYFDNEAVPTDGENIYFRIQDVKGIGESKLSQMQDAFSKLDKKSTSFDIFRTGVPPSILTKLIKVGALSHTKKSRSLLFAELVAWETLSDKEKEWTQGIPAGVEVIDMLERVAPLKKEGGATHTEKRKRAVLGAIDLLKNPRTRLTDTPAEIAFNEQELLGISLTCSAVDSCDISESNTTCKEYLTGRSGFMVFAVKIDDVLQKITKSGKSKGSKMATISVSDGSGAVEMVCFPESYKLCGDLLYTDNTVLIQAKRNYKDKNQLIVEKVKQL